MQLYRFAILSIIVTGSLVHALIANAGEPVGGVNISVEQCGGPVLPPCTSVNFGGPDIPEIPAGSFGPGSAAFNGTIVFDQAVPMQLVRVNDANFSLGADTLNIELVGLQLVSSNPIAFDGALWDVSASLSMPATGQMTLDHNAATEGGFVLSSFLDLSLDFVFSSTGRGTVATGRIETLSLGGGPTRWDHPAGDPSGLVYLDVLDYSSPNGDLTLSFGQVPEPSTALLISLGLVGLATRRRVLG